MANFKASIITLESLKTTKFWMFLAAAILSPYQRAKASALLFETEPRPRVKDISIMPLGPRRIPPPPATHGFPFNTLSKNKQCSSRFDLHFINSCSSSRISQQALKTGLEFFLFWWFGTNSLSQWSSSRSKEFEFLRVFLDSKIFPRNSFILFVTRIELQLSSQNNLLFLSSQIFHKVNLENHIQHVLRRSFFLRMNGDRLAQLFRRSSTFVGREKWIGYKFKTLSYTSFS